MATIIEKKNKAGELISYKVMVCVGRDEQNKQIWRTTTIKRPEGLTPKKERDEIKRQADAWEQEQRADYERTHSKEDKSKISFEAFVREKWWKDHVMDGTLKPNSISFYGNTSNNLIEYFGKKKLTSIDAEAIKRYIKYLNTEAKSKGGKPYSATTIQHYFRTLRNIMEYARHFHYIRFDPCQDLSQREKPHRGKREIDFLEPEDARRFIAKLDNEPIYWKCLMTVLLTTGLRRGEAIGLQWGDIDADKLTVSVNRSVSIDRTSPDKQHIGTPKTEESIRTVPITQRVYALLMTLKREQEAKYQATLLPSAFIFCRDCDPYLPCYPTEPTRWTRKFIKRNHLPNVSPHDLRHTAATLALESGADLKQVQELLGHKDAATTMQFYAGVTEEGKRRTVEGIESILRSKTKQA